MSFAFGFADPGDDSDDDDQASGASRGMAAGAPATPEIPSCEVACGWPEESSQVDTSRAETVTITPSLAMLKVPDCKPSVERPYVQTQSASWPSCQS
jgi:hypothetical protein